jgi:hypothetical protein
VCKVWPWQIAAADCITYITVLYWNKHKSNILRHCVAQYWSILYCLYMKEEQLWQFKRNSALCETQLTVERLNVVHKLSIQTHLISPRDLFKDGSVASTAVQWTAVQLTAVQWTAIQWTAVQWTAVQLTAVQWTAVQWTAVQSVNYSSTEHQKHICISSTANFRRVL